LFLGELKMSKPTSATNISPVLLFGLDQSGKPKAGRFAGTHAEEAKHAAATMNLTVIEVATPQAEDLAKKMPVGRIHARGKAFIPFIKRELFDRLTALKAGLGDSAADATAHPGKKLAASGATPPLASALPQSWDSLAPGHLVLVQESLEEGWWECLVLNREADILTLRFRDYPKVPSFQLHLRNVALLHPGVSA
jgi:hypothetical protein